MGEKKWYVYIIQAESGKLYTGITTDVERRFKEHSSLAKKAKFFHFAAATKMVFYQSYANRSLALKREIAIKKMTREQKLNLIKEEKKISLPQAEEDVLAECRFEAFRASGKGGQHVNVTDSAVRLTHLPSGIVVTSQKEKSQHLNKKECLAKLRKEVAKRNYRKPKRVATKVPFSVKVQNKVKKEKKSAKKRRRQTDLSDLDL